MLGWPHEHPRVDDYQDTVRTLGAFTKIAGHQVTSRRDHKA
jgi:hypothetical protein